MVVKAIIVTVVMVLVMKVTGDAVTLAAIRESDSNRSNIDISGQV